MSFLGCFLGCLAGQFCYKYFTNKVDRMIFEYKAEQEIKRKWLDE